MAHRNIEVCFAPPLFPYLGIKENALYVVVDILRATTSMSIAFKNGVKNIVPVAEVEKTRKFKDLGYLIAGERNCQKIEGFDFGNSPFDFIPEKVTGKTIAYTTTNCTQAIELAKNKGDVMIAAFVNMASSISWMSRQQKDIVIFCAGWENNFCLEDTVFAGVLIELLMKEGTFIPKGDSALVSLNLCREAGSNYAVFLKQASHRNRLLQFYNEQEIDYCFSTDIAENVIVLKDGFLINLI